MNNFKESDLASLHRHHLLYDLCRWGNLLISLKHFNFLEFQVDLMEHSSLKVQPQNYKVAEF